VLNYIINYSNFVHKKLTFYFVLHKCRRRHYWKRWQLNPKGRIRLYLQRKWKQPTNKLDRNTGCIALLTGQLQMPPIKSGDAYKISMIPDLTAFTTHYTVNHNTTVLRLLTSTLRFITSNIRLHSSIRISLNDVFQNKATHNPKHHQAGNHDSNILSNLYKAPCNRKGSETTSPAACQMPRDG